MLFKSQVLRWVGNMTFSGALFFTLCTGAQSNLTFRVMAANITSGNYQSYETAGINIFRGLKPDIVAIQEFQYNSSSASNDLRTLVNTAFGTNYSFYCEPGYNIPNGIVSRWPIISSGTVASPEVSDRGFAWARINLPGTNDLYVVSVHLYGSGSASQRNNEAMTITNLMGTNFPAGAWIIVGGDFNTDSRSEACVTTFKTRLSDSPIPADNNGNSNTSEPRSKPYDYALPSFSLANYLTPVVLTSHTFNNGLVFDSAVYTPLSDVSPVTSGDSHTNQMQHMAVVKDFLISVTNTNSPTTNTPSIATPPQSQTVAIGSNAVFTVAADGTAPLAYQWRFNGTNLSGANATTLALTNVQFTNAGNYSVVITNIAGSITSSVATLTVNTSAPGTTNVVISQIYGGGGNTSASYQNDYVELFNPTASAVTISTWSVQYASSSGTSWQVVNLAGTIQPYRYYLVKLASGGAVGSLLPLADATGGVNISASQGKVALVSSQTALSGSNPIGAATIVDFVGYGSANAFEGSATAAGAPSGNNATSILRKNGGLTDSNDNANDFTTLSPPAPRNSASPANPPSTPATAAVLSAPSFNNNQFQMLVTGTASSNYVMLAATNLTVTNWIPLFTNTSPFIFTDANLTTPQKFYRATVQP